MRRLLGASVVAVLTGVTAVLILATPAQAFAHDRVQNPYLHTTLDIATLLVVTAPLWTTYFWGVNRRSQLLALVVFLQIPVAIIGFVPIVDPVLHATLFALALGLTVFSLWFVRRGTARHKASAGHIAEVAH